MENKITEKNKIKEKNNNSNNNNKIDPSIFKNLKKNKPVKEQIKLDSKGKEIKITKKDLENELLKSSYEDYNSQKRSDNLILEILLIFGICIIIAWVFFEYIGYIPEDDGILDIFNPLENFQSNRENIEIEKRYDSVREFPEFRTINENDNYKQFVDNWDLLNDINFKKISTENNNLLSNYRELTEKQFINLMNISQVKINNQFLLKYNLDNFEKNTTDFNIVYDYQNTSNQEFINELFIENNCKIVIAHILGSLNKQFLISDLITQNHKFEPFILMSRKVIKIYKIKFNVNSNPNNDNIYVFKIIFNIGRLYKTHHFNLTTFACIKNPNSNKMKIKLNSKLNGMSVDKININDNIAYLINSNTPEQKPIFNNTTNIFDKTNELSNNNSSKFISNKIYGPLERNQTKLDIDNNKFSTIIQSSLRQINKNKENDYREKYKCFHPEARDKIIEVNNKIHCESIHDDLNNNFGVWDKPCLKNTDCPYFKANKNYNNNFGGCKNDKTCEMPVGVSRLGYTKVLKGSEPLCHNCINENDTKCCQEQKNKNLYPNLNSPDYIFLNDNLIRNQ